MTNREEAQRPFHRKETVVTLYNGPDRTPELDELQEKVDRLRREHPAAAEPLQERLDELRGLNDSTHQPGPPKPETAEVFAANLSRWLEEFRDAERAAGDLVRRVPVKYLRQMALLRIFCKDCNQMLIGLVLPVAERPLLVTRARRGGFETSVWLDGTFWGGVVFCRRKKYALQVSDLRTLLMDGRDTLLVDHAMK